MIAASSMALLLEVRTRYDAAGRVDVARRRVNGLPAGETMMPGRAFLAGRLATTVLSLLGASLVVLFACLPTDAQQIGRLSRVGVMAVTEAADLDRAWREGLRRHGWIEGQNIAIEYRYSQGNDARFADFAAE